jgi:hypothetical protein
MRALGWLAAVAAAALASACSRTPGRASQAQAEPPTLWSIQTLDDQGKATKTMLICADNAVRESFSRPMPSPNGQPCRLVAPAVDTGGRFAARCRSGDRLLDVQSESSGDLTRDYTIKLLIRADVQVGQSFSQTIHYRRLGACPDGWAAGDAAAPGDLRAVNAVSGTAHTLAAPAPAPPQ